MKQSWPEAKTQIKSIKEISCIFPQRSTTYVETLIILLMSIIQTHALQYPSPLWKKKIIRNEVINPYEWSFLKPTTFLGGSLSNLHGPHHLNSIITTVRTPHTHVRNQSSNHKLTTTLVYLSMSRGEKVFPTWIKLFGFPIMLLFWDSTSSPLDFSSPWPWWSSNSSSFPNEKYSTTFPSPAP